KTLLKQKNIRTVMQRKEGHEGRYRVQKLVHVAGERQTLTQHNESGVRMVVDVAKVYFSPRLGTERLRIAKLVKRGESVIVLFGGVAPYALVIAKHAKPSKIVSVEWNPSAHKLAEENIALNKANVQAVKGNARGAKGSFDRVIMMHPAGAYHYLESARRLCKRGGTVHVYAFVDEENVQRRGVQLATKLRGVVRHAQKTAQISPRRFRMCYDILTKHA
ncbi:tRNA methyltransferase, partial [Candidatus Woesearchaeota archaeon]|nr:tRNA methyltransferase [Candidatus Woesearchaeota archaeon]